jgi:hypothetical protein
VPTGYYLLDHRTKPDNWYPSRRTPLRVIAVHITAGLEDLDAADASAERTARYAATTDRKVSWHSGSDSDSFLRLLPASYTAWHCAGFNSESYGHEISKATTRWTGMPAAWLERTLTNAAACLRPVVAAHKIPLRVLTREQVRDGAYGFAAHSELDPARRTDPGRDFPWQRFLALLAEPPAQEDDTMETIGPGSDKSTVALMQRCLVNEARTNGRPNPLPRWGADGDYGTETRDAVQRYRELRGIWTSKPDLCGGLTLSLLLRYEHGG